VPQYLKSDIFDFKFPFLVSLTSTPECWLASLINIEVAKYIQPAMTLMNLYFILNLTNRLHIKVSISSIEGHK